MKLLHDYIKRVTGLDVTIESVDNDSLKTLPLFIRQAFDFYQGTLDDRTLIFLIPNPEDRPAPKQLQSQIPKIEDAFGLNAVLVLEDIDSYVRNRLTEMKIAFIVIGEQLYIPFMFLSLDERKRKKLREVETFYPATQSLIIYHLRKSPLHGMNLSEIADHFPYSQMTITRAVREMEAVGLCVTTGAKEKVLEFPDVKRDVWEQGIEFMRTPVKKAMQVRYRPLENSMVIAGISALSRYSNLSPDLHQTFAVRKDALRHIEEKGVISEQDEIQIEVWRYDPVLLSADGVADPFSVYLSLQDHPDERVQAALEEMIEGAL